MTGTGSGTTARKAASNGRATHAAALPVFDLDAYQAEARRDPFCFKLGGTTFEMPHMADLDWHTGLGDDGNPGDPTVHTLLRAGLGDQWAAFDSHKLTSGAYNELWNRWRQHSGVDLGEGGASQDS